MRFTHLTIVRKNGSNRNGIGGNREYKLWEALLFLMPRSPEGSYNFASIWFFGRGEEK